MQRTELAVLAYTASGAALAVRLQEVLKDRCCVYLHSAHAAKDTERRLLTIPFSDTGTLLDAVWGQADAILYISAAGIAVRTIAPYLSSKSSDPAVLCMDDTAQYVIPLASGHLGGANEWAERIAAIFGAEAVITTSTDRNGVFAVDLFAKAHNLVCADPEKIRKISGALLAGEKVGYCCDEKYASDNYQYCDLAEGEHVYAPLAENNADAIAKLLGTILDNLQFIPWDGPWKNVPELDVTPAGISSASVVKPELQGAAYNLQGVRTTNTRKGVQVVDGRKVIVR